MWKETKEKFTSLMKILNLYAGIGGNRALWGDKHKITSVELNEKIANKYKLLYPNDNIIIADAHEYLLEHYKEYDFIWSSPPCQSHSKTNYFTQHIRKKTCISFNEFVSRNNFFTKFLQRKVLCRKCG